MITKPKKVGLYSQSPTNNLSRKFLKELMLNNYISKGGKEYAKCEVDALYFEKCNRLAETQAKKDWIAYHKAI